MAGTTFSVGRDVSAVLIGPNGNRFDFTNLTNFDIKPEYKTARCDPLNVPPAERALPAGYRITFSIDRRNAQNDAAFLAIEQAWWAVGSADNGTGSNGSVTVQITEVGGGTTTEQYQGVTVMLTNKGSISQDSPIKQSISVFASQRVS